MTVEFAITIWAGETPIRTRPGATSSFFEVSLESKVASEKEERKLRNIAFYDRSYLQGTSALNQSKCRIVGWRNQGDTKQKLIELIKHLANTAVNTHCDVAEQSCFCLWMSNNTVNHCSVFFCGQHHIEVPYSIRQTSIVLRYHLEHKTSPLAVE